MTVEDVLTAARGELGHKEYPPNSNKTRYGLWYGLNGQPWCMIFIQWLFYKCGDQGLLPKRTASCTEFMTAAKKSGRWYVKNYQPGDIVLFDFDNKRSNAEHVGIVERAEKDHLITIEGNTAIGNDDDGGSVMRRSRKLSVVIGAFRPKYEPIVKSIGIAAVAQEVLDGKWGDGETRKAKLRAAGYDPAEVQSYVNVLASNSKKKSLDIVAAECADGAYGNGLIRKARLKLAGYTTDEIALIQKKVNEILRT